MPNVVHIGLGKTATTTLQRHVFPQVSKEKGYFFNDPALVGLLRKSETTQLSGREQRRVQTILSEQNNFVSMESLVNWNPALWAAAADRNTALFGSKTKIVITFREPLAWMVSVYQQMVQEGNVITPEAFFLSEDEYCLAEKLVRPNSLEYFCPDYVDFPRLQALYAERFETVACVNLPDIADMAFLAALFDMSQDEIARFAHSFRTAPRENRAYSQLGMRLTFRREKLLNRLGLKSVGSFDRRLQDWQKGWKPKRCAKGAGQESARTNGQTGAERPRRRRVTLVPTWRRFVQGFLNKRLPYRPYTLPDSAYRNDALIEKNRAFLEELSARADRKRS